MPAVDVAESGEEHGADVLATEMPGAEHAVIRGASHGAHQSHPAELAALIRRALDRIPAP